MTMMENDASSSLFNNFAQMINQVYGDKLKAEAALKELQVTLDEIYQGHPDIKVSMEAKAKSEKEAATKKGAKVVKSTK